jgi:hypothetical protein
MKFILSEVCNNRFSFTTGGTLYFHFTEPWGSAEHHLGNVALIVAQYRQAEQA